MENKYTLELTDYLINNHPYMITDKEFIQSRGDLAMTESINQYKAGCNIEECEFFANKVLYAGLVFSPYCKIKEILENHFDNDLLYETINETAIKLYHKFKYVFDEYSLNDTFEGGEECLLLEDRLIDLIDKEKKEYGL